MSVINLFDNLKVPGFPAAKDPFYVTVQMSGDEGDPFLITVEGPDDLRVELANSSLNLAPLDGPFHQRSFILASVSRPAVFAKEGIYYVVVRSGDREVHRRPFGVYLAPETRVSDDAAGGQS